MTDNNVVVGLDDFLAAKFDYLVLGGGMAGLAVAGRLAEDPNISVGVLEAGKDRRGDPLVDMPLAMPQMFENSDYDWVHRTAPQKFNNDKRHHVVRGRMLGGSSAINAMMYVRGSEADYDSWAHILGDDSWNAEAMMKYMKKHEGLEDLSEAVTDRSSYHYRPEFHGTTGPIHTSFNESKMPVEDAFLQACNDSISLSAPADAWSGSHVGFTMGLGSISRRPGKRGKRSYAINYLEGKSPKNLKVLCEAHVNRVNLEGTTATGANFTFAGGHYDVKANREVIVSGGTIKSPQILELSGIGDPEVLKQAGVELRVDNRGIGANVQDHSATSLCVDVKDDVFTIDRFNSKPELAQVAAVEYMTSGTGIFSNVFAGTGFIPYKKLVSSEELAATIESIKGLEPSSDFHRRQLDEIVKQLSSETSANIQVAFFPLTFNAGVVAEHQGPNREKRTNGAGITYVLCTEYPVSRGTIHITNADPTSDPEINPNYGQAFADQQVLAASLRWADRARKNRYLSDFVTDKRTFPPAGDDLEDLSVGRKAVAEAIISEYHICGSVAMGDALDSRLRVKGAQNLRVVDASAFPGNVSGNIASTVYALAEKAADMIKEDRV